MLRFGLCWCWLLAPVESFLLTHQIPHFDMVQGTLFHWNVVWMFGKSSVKRIQFLRQTELPDY